MPLDTGLWNWDIFLIHSTPVMMEAVLFTLITGKCDESAGLCLLRTGVQCSGSSQDPGLAIGRCMSLLVFEHLLSE